MDILQIILLSIIQGICELLPVSSSAHVLVASKLMGLDPSSPEMTYLLVMLHTGTMFAVIVYFWKSWKQDYFSSFQSFLEVAKQVILATAMTGLIGGALIFAIEKVLLREYPKAEVEMLFGKMPLIAAALAFVGLFILLAGRSRSEANEPLNLARSALIGAVQGFCLPFRGFSRSGATISTGLVIGVSRMAAEKL